MNLVILYGPPAVGKLTVATRLVKKTDYTLFHNHLTINFVRNIHPKRGVDHFALCDKIRLAVFESAAKTGLDMVFTFAYSNDPADNAFIVDTIATVEAQGGRVFFAQFVAPEEEILRRVGNQSRFAHGKLTDPEILKEFLKARNGGKIKHLPHVTINTHMIQPDDAAEQIIKRFDLSINHHQPVNT